MTDSSPVAESPSDDADSPPDPAIKLRLSKPHQLIGKTTYKCDPKNNRGHSFSNDPEGVDVRVTRGKFRVALAVMDRLFKAIEKQDVQVRLERDQSRCCTYAFSGHHDKCQLYIEEEHRRVEHVLTAEEQAEKARYRFFSAPGWDFVATGKLVLHPGGAVDLTSQEALDGLIERAVEQIAATIDRAREERKQREEAQRKEFARQQRQQKEKERTDSLYKSADALHCYRLLMEYIEEVRRFGVIPSDQLRDGQTMDDWLEWARAKARAVHPLG
jgi:hypothetical protein